MKSLYLQVTENLPKLIKRVLIYIPIFTYATYYQMTKYNAIGQGYCVYVSCAIVKFAKLSTLIFETMYNDFREYFHNYKSRYINLINDETQSLRK